MKIYTKNSSNQKSPAQIKNILIDRLNLQSTRRTLENYKLKNYSLNYFESPEFAGIFQTWDDRKKENFLKDVGGFYWKNLGEFIGR